ncbi:MAG TPA: restriction endonuclease subunit S [Saprospiraceae bacterium]|nr:restriction endonuclease subunit S [Syntrophorhabdus sp.]HQP76686.1 restriction endonuclease subunit S [Saprospiraceae bacterium]
MVPTGWAEFKIKDIGEVITGKTPSSNNPEHFGSVIPFVTPTDFKDYIKNIYYAERGISKEGITAFRNKILPLNSILVTCIGSDMGKVAMNKVPCLTNQQINSIIVKEGKASPDLIYYSLLSKYKLLRAMATSGSTMPIVNKGDFEKIVIYLPRDISEQSRIASILSSLDDKIELNLQMNKTLEAIAQAIFKEWFVDFRFPGFEGELVDGLPKGWEKGKLSDIANISIGRTPPRNEHKWFSKNPEDIKWISIKDMGTSGVYITDTSEYLTPEAKTTFRIPEISENTLILSFKLTVGRISITTEKMLSNEAIAQIRSTFGVEFLYCYLANYRFDSLGSTSSIATAINSRTIKEMPVLIPDHSVVTQFCAMVRPIFDRIRLNSHEVMTVENIRNELLPKLMTGKIRVA